MDPPLDPTATEMPERVEPMLARLSDAARERSPSGRSRSSGTGCARSPTPSPGGCACAAATATTLLAAYPELRALNRALGSRAAILDGEIVAFDEDGRPSFEALQPRMHQRGEAAVRRLMRTTPVTYVVFDLLWLDGHSLMELPYAQRRERLAELGLEGDHWRILPLHVGDGAGLLAATREQGLEGIVAKRLDSRYTPRSARRAAG